MQTTRYFALAMLMTAAVATAQQAPAPPPTLVKVREDVFVTDDGVILVDTKNERMHDDLLAKVKSVTNRPIRYAVLTHNHADHSAGASKLQAEGVTIVGSLGTRENMLRANQPGAPQVAYSGYSQLALGGKEVQLREVGDTRGVIR